MAEFIPIYQVDAFTDTVFGGNSAVVSLLDNWLPDAVLQKIAAEHNQPETAFLVPSGDHYEIRWFTPSCEVDLCGHATLASAFVIFNYCRFSGNRIQFNSVNRGVLYVEKKKDMLELDFPADSIEQSFLPYGLIDAFGFEPKEVYQGKDDYLLVFENEDQIRNLRPDLEAVASIETRGVICTARGESVDFVSRFFGPQSGIDEDPVTGSAHTTLTPYWAKKLNKKALKAMQLSERGGYLEVSVHNDRVKIAGSAVLFMKGEVYIGPR